MGLPSAFRVSYILYPCHCEHGPVTHHEDYEVIWPHDGEAVTSGRYFMCLVDIRPEYVLTKSEYAHPSW